MRTRKHSCWRRHPSSFPLPCRGSVGTLEPALLFSLHSEDSVWPGDPPSLSAEQKDSSFCLLDPGFHLDGTAFLCIFMCTKWPQPQGGRPLPGKICMEQESKPSATQKNLGVETPRYHCGKGGGQCWELRDTPSTLGWTHPVWDLPRLGCLSWACRKLCTWVPVHVGVSL